MIIMCDIDNVLNDLTAKTLALYNSRYDKKISLSDLTAYNFSDCLSQSDTDALMELFKEKELWDSLEPLPDSQWGIATLINMGHRVIFATATHECNFEWKCRWMLKNFPMINSADIIRVKDKSLIKADVIVDDCMEQLISSCCDRICLDYMWNRDSNKDYVYDIRRAYNWKEIVKLINEIERWRQEWEK